MIWYILAISLGIIVVCVVVFSNVKITTTQVEIPAKYEKTFVHLSDLHKKSFGKDYEKLLSKISQTHIDGIFFTGDLISRSENDFSKKISLMEKLCRIAPVYFIGGNHEADVPEIYESLCAELEKIGVIVLRNKSTHLLFDNETLTVTGLEPEGRFFKNADGTYKNLPKFNKAYLDEKLGNKKNSFTILLAHSPFAFEEYEKWGADLVLCGHVHGGVVRLPFVGGVLSPERKFFPKYSSGVFAKNHTTMIVSRGLGKFRIFNPSEIVLIKFKGA